MLAIKHWLERWKSCLTVQYPFLWFLFLDYFFIMYIIMHIHNWFDAYHATIAHVHITFVKYAMTFMVAAKKMSFNWLNWFKEIFTNFNGDVLWLSWVKPDNFSYVIFGQFIVIFIFVIWWFALVFSLFKKFCVFICI